MTAAWRSRAQVAPGIVVITTLGSRWELWETEHLYRRSPRTEADRENPAWGGPEAGPLQDHVWHPFRFWLIDEEPVRPRLWILLPDSTTIRAPYPMEGGRRVHECARGIDLTIALGERC